MRALRIALLLGALAAPLPAWCELTPILADFLGMRDRQGRVIFDPFYISLPEEERREWLELKRSAGLTHIVLATTISYPRYPVPGRDLRRDIPTFRKYVQEVMDAGFVPIIYLSSGDRGTGGDVRDFGRIIDGLRELIPRAIWVPGWEVVGPGGGWSSRELSDALKTMRASLGKEGKIYLHLVPERPFGTSNPLEDDDPWQGSETDFYRSNGGEFVSGLLYQTPHGAKLLDPVDSGVGEVAMEPGNMALCDTRHPKGGYYSDYDWRCRLKEITDRLLFGYRGYRYVDVVLYETVAYDYYRGNATEAQAMAIADEALKFGISSFGNGLPSILRKGGGPLPPVPPGGGKVPGPPRPKETPRPRPSPATRNPELIRRVAAKYGASSNWNALRGRVAEDPLLQEFAAEYGGGSNWNALRPAGTGEVADLIRRVAEKYGAGGNWNALKGRIGDDPLLQALAAEYGADSNWNALRPAP